MRRNNRIARRRRTTLVLGGLVALSSLAVPVLSAHADQASCGQVIRGNFTLGNDLVGCAGDGLVVGAGGVTIDLGGHVIRGTGLGAAVRNNGHADVTIRNGTIANFDHGVSLNPGTVRNTVAGLTFTETELAGVHANGASGNHIQDNRGHGFSGVAFHLTGGATSNWVGRNTLGAGNGEAFVVEGGSNYNRIEANTVGESSDTAARVDFSSHTSIIGNTFSGGSDAAIATNGSPRSVVQSNTVSGVGDAAVLIENSNANVVRFNKLGQSADAGVVMSNVTDSLIKANTMALSGDAAIALRLGSSNIRVIDNQADHSSDAGVFLGDGVGNVVRGNLLTGNATGIEVSGGQQNTVEFNAANGGLGAGIEVSGSANNTVYANTTNNNGTGGIIVDGGSLSANVKGNQAWANGGDGISIEGLGTAVEYNLAVSNGGWGIYGKDGVIDRGGNGARGNAEAAQCYMIVCNDGHGWVAPVRPPEPLDPLEIGLEGGVAPPRVRSARQPKKKKRLVVVSCKQKRIKPARKAGRGRAKAKAKVRTRTVCRASYKAKRGTRRVVGRLVRDDHYVASGKRDLKRAGRGRLSLRAHRRPRSGRYTLVLTFRGQGGKATVVRRVVRVR